MPKFNEAMTQIYQEGFGRLLNEHNAGIIATREIQYLYDEEIDIPQEDVDEAIGIRTYIMDNPETDDLAEHLDEIRECLTRVLRRA